jgi:hypothetical protein
VGVHGHRGFHSFADLLTPTGQARLKAAAAHWRRAQKEFEMAVGAADAADLRTVLQRVISLT